MAVSSMETALLESDGTFTGTVTVSCSPSSICATCVLSAVSDTSNSFGYITGIVQYQTHNFFGGPTTHSFWANAPWYIPNSIFDSNVQNVTFYIDTWDDDYAFARALGT